MKFKLDENTPWVLKKVIENLGQHVVDSVFHENITGIDDKSLNLHCINQERILITLDSDFINMKKFYGILILRPKTQGKEAVKSIFKKFLEAYNIEDIKGKIIIVESNQIRIRR